MEVVSKHKNDLVYFSGLLNFAKTEANTIVKGSLNANMGEDWEGLTTVPFLNAILQSFECFFFFCLGPLIIYDLGGGVVQGFCLSQNKIYLIPPPPGSVVF